MAKYPAGSLYSPDARSLGCSGPVYYRHQVVDAEIRRLVSALQAIGPMRRTTLARECRSSLWGLGTFQAAVLEGIRQGRIRALPFDFLAAELNPPAPRRVDEIPSTRPAARSAMAARVPVSVQPAGGVLRSEVDERVDEVSVEEQVAEQLAVCWAVTPEQTVQQREVRGAKALQVTVAGAEDC